MLQQLNLEQSDLEYDVNDEISGGCNLLASTKSQSSVHSTKSIDEIFEKTEDVEMEQSAADDCPYTRHRQGGVTIYPRTGNPIYCCKKHTSKSSLHSRPSINQQSALHNQHEPRVYIPRVMADLMQATTANSTSVHFGVGHMCHKHNRVYTVDHIAECDQL